MGKDEHGALVERHREEILQVLGEKYYTAWVVDEWMNMEQWWNVTDKELEVPR